MKIDFMCTLVLYNAMPKNITGGNKSKKGKNLDRPDLKGIPVKENEDEDYALVERMLGNGRLHVICSTDNKIRLAHIRGAMFYKKVKIQKGDILLVSIRPYQKEKCDVLYKYEDSQLQQKGIQVSFSRMEEGSEEGIMIGDEGLDINIDAI